MGHLEVRDMTDEEYAESMDSYNAMMEELLAGVDKARTSTAEGLSETGRWIPEDQIYDVVPYFSIVEDGVKKIWDTRNACFVTDIPENAPVSRINDSEGNSTREHLHYQLKESGLPLGELATTEDHAEVIRAERDKRLQEDCDPISGVRWNSMSTELRTAWEQYRQALLDIPQTEGFPWNGNIDDVPWPTKPA